jgi:CDP-glucose 4,6-dehydratase
VRAWSDNKPVVIRNPDATRPWQHVFEPLSGYLWLGAKLMADSLGKYQEAFNFGPLSDSVYTVRSVLDTIAQYLKGASWKVENTDNFKKESSLLKLCCDKALHKLNWHSVLSFDETIEMTAKWYEAYYNRTNNQTKNRTREISLDQLQEYVAKAQAKGLEWSK